MKLIFKSSIFKTARRDALVGPYSNDQHLNKQKEEQNRR